MARIYAIPVDVHFTDERRAEREEWLGQVLGGDHQVRVEAPRTGALFLETAFDQLLTARGLLELGLEAQEQGFDAVAVLCMTDPSVDALREALDIPVVGSAQAACLTAAMVAGRFSIVTIMDATIPIVEKAVAASGVDPRAVASIRSIDMSIAAMIQDPDAVVERLEVQAQRAVKEDGARGIILGCTEMGKETAPRLSAKLGIPVLDANVTAVQMARVLAEMGYGHSRLAFPKPMGDLAQRFTSAAAVGRT